MAGAVWRSGIALGLVLTAVGPSVSGAVREPAAPPATVVAPKSTDFNGDGWADLAVGVPLEDIETVVNAGAVSILYGSSTGLSGEDQFFYQGYSGLEGEPEAFDAFGNAVAMGDFDGDGYTDLAVGVSGDDLGGTISSAGSVQVLYGSASGLTTIGDQLWTQDSPGMLDASEASDLFGLELAAGDFNGDGFADLAIGIPFEDLGALSNAGAVQILFGSLNGLTATGNQLLTQDTAGIANVAEANDGFGQALAAGDFGNGPEDDLAIGVPLEGVGSVGQAGAVHVLYGSVGGLTANGSQFVTQSTPGIPNLSEPFDRFGSKLAAANFGKSNHADLAVGIPDEDVGTFCCQGDHGAVIVVYGSASGLTAMGSQFIHQDIPGIPDTAEPSDGFGDALAGGDFNGDAIADLAVGVPGEGIGGASGAGAVHVFYGSSTGLTAAGTQFWAQGSSGLVEGPEPGDAFGTALAAANFGHSTQPDQGHADLAIGVRGEDFTIGTDVGGVQIVYGSPAGLDATGNQILFQDFFLGVNEFDDEFGSDLAAR